MLYSARTCLETVSELTLACGNNSTSFPKVIGDVKGCILVKSSRHPEMKITFPVPLISLLSIIPVLISVSSIVAIVIVRYHTMKVPVVR